MNVAAAIAATPSSSAAPAAAGGASMGGFGALVDQAAADDAGSGDAKGNANANANANANDAGGDPSPNVGAGTGRLPMPMPMPMPMPASRWPGLTAQAGVAAAASNAGAGDDKVPAGTTQPMVSGQLLAAANAAAASKVPTPAATGNAPQAPTSDPSASAPVIVDDTPPAPQASASNQPSPTAAHGTSEVPSPAPAAAKPLVLRDLPHARVSIADADTPADVPQSVSTSNDGATATPVQGAPDEPVAAATAGPAPEKLTAEVHDTPAAPPRAGQLRTKLVADLSVTPTPDTDIAAASPPAGKGKAHDGDDAGEQQDLPPAAAGTAMQADPTAVAIATTMPAAPVATLLPRVSAAADSDQPASSTPAIAARAGEAQSGDLTAAPVQIPAAAATAHASDAGAPVFTVQAPTPATVQPQAAASAAPVVVAQPGRIGREVGVQIARHVSDGKSEMTIRLDPASMGRIDVRLSFDDSGRLSAAVHADNPASLDMLRREAHDLGRSLADAGIRADVSAFSFDSRQSGGGGAGGFGQPGQQHPRSPHAEARYASGPSSDGAPSSFRPLRTSDRVDLIA